MRDLVEIIEAAQDRMNPRTPWQKTCQKWSAKLRSIDWPWVGFCACLAIWTVATVVAQVARIMEG